MQFDFQEDPSASIIKVIGIGGGGNNAVNFMYNLGISGVNFVVCNTDAQALEKSPVPTKIQLGPSLTDGRGAGAVPEVGKAATIESEEEIRAILAKNTKMCFVTAGMGGGTGTCLLYTSPSPRDRTRSRMPSSASKKQHELTKTR